MLYTQFTYNSDCFLLRLMPLLNESLSICNLSQFFLFTIDNIWLKLEKTDFQTPTWSNTIYVRRSCIFRFFHIFFVDKGPFWKKRSQSLLNFFFTPQKSCFFWVFDPKMTPFLTLFWYFFSIFSYFYTPFLPYFLMQFWPNFCLKSRIKAIFLDSLLTQIQISPYFKKTPKMAIFQKKG